MSDIVEVINLIKEKHCYDCICLDAGDCHGCEVYNIIGELEDAFIEYEDVQNASTVIEANNTQGEKK